MMGEGEGRSRDISEAGTFVLTNALPPVGASIDVAIQLPAWQVGAARGSAAHGNDGRSDPGRRAPRARTEMGLCNLLCEDIAKKENG